MYTYGKLSLELLKKHAKFFSEFSPSYFSLQEGASYSDRYLEGLLFGAGHEADAFIIVDDRELRIDCVVIVFRPRKLYKDAYISVLIPGKRRLKIKELSSCVLGLLNAHASISGVRAIRSDIAAFESDPGKLLKSMEFEEEGRLKGQLLFRGKYVDSLIYTKIFGSIK